MWNVLLLDDVHCRTSADHPNDGGAGEHDTSSENVPVFLLPPNPRDSDRSQIGQKLTRALGQELNRRPAFRWVPLDSVGLIHDVAADLYASSCPPDEIIGCAYVLGDRGGAKYAVATHIELVESGTQIEVHLINVEDAEAAFSFQIVWLKTMRLRTQKGWPSYFFVGNGSNRSKERHSRRSRYRFGRRSRPSIQNAGG